MGERAKAVLVPCSFGYSISIAFLCKGFPLSPSWLPRNNYQLLHPPETRVAKDIEGKKGTKLYLYSAFRVLSRLQTTFRQRACCLNSRRCSPKIHSKPRTPAVLCSPPWLAVGLGTGKRPSERDYGLCVVQESGTAADRFTLTFTYTIKNRAHVPRGG